MSKHSLLRHIWKPGHSQQQYFLIDGHYRAKPITYMQKVLYFASQKAHKCYSMKRVLMRSMHYLLNYLVGILWLLSDDNDKLFTSEENYSSTIVKNLYWWLDADKIPLACSPITLPPRSILLPLLKYHASKFGIYCWHLQVLKRPFVFASQGAAWKTMLWRLYFASPLLNFITFKSIMNSKMSKGGIIMVPPWPQIHHQPK